MSRPAAFTAIAGTRDNNSNTPHRSPTTGLQLLKTILINHPVLLACQHVIACVLAKMRVTDLHLSLAQLNTQNRTRTMKHKIMMARLESSTQTSLFPG